jgi:peptidoglycan/xylan/chitin deacetylase (PgdA/CDA1 family)
MIKPLLIRVAHLPGMASLWRQILKNRATILMLHRFNHPDLGGRGHDPALIRGLIAFLRREQFEILPLDELFERLSGAGRPLRGAVAFTIDDGYIDQAIVGARIFAEYDCPATIFVTTGFLDGKIWQWWDRIDHIFRSTRRQKLTTGLGAETVRYEWRDDRGRTLARNDFELRCKSVPHSVKETAIYDLGHAAEVDLPELPPARYAPMSWSDVRSCEALGTRFAPHTVTHPILSRLPPAESLWEIRESWDRVRAEARDPLPIFAYPNGSDDDFDDREINILRELGFRGGLRFGEQHAVCPFTAADQQFLVPRIGFPDTMSQVLQTVSGLGELRRALFAGIRVSAPQTRSAALEPIPGLTDERAGIPETKDLVPLSRSPDSKEISD